MSDAQNKPIRQRGLTEHIPIKDFYTPYDAAVLLGTNPTTIWKMSNREHDPLPLKRMIGRKRGSVIFRQDLIEWARRNFVQIVGE